MGGRLYNKQRRRLTYMHAYNWFQTDEQIFQAMRKTKLRIFKKKNSDQKINIHV